MDVGTTVAPVRPGRMVANRCGGGNRRTQQTGLDHVGHPGAVGLSIFSVGLQTQDSKNRGWIFRASERFAEGLRQVQKQVRAAAPALRPLRVGLRLDTVRFPLSFFRRAKGNAPVAAHTVAGAHDAVLVLRSRCGVHTCCAI